MPTARLPRHKKPTVTRSVRFIEDIARLLDSYADDQMISSNAALNKLLKEKLAELGYQLSEKS